MRSSATAGQVQACRNTQRKGGQRVSSGQERFDHLPPVARRTDDYLGILPAGVMPISCEVLEQGGSLLVVKRYDHGQKITPKQRQIFLLLANSYGGADTAPGTITVLALWGRRNATKRMMATFARGAESAVRAVTDEEIRNFISLWWAEHGSGHW